MSVTFPVNSASLAYDRGWSYEVAAGTIISQVRTLCPPLLCVDSEVWQLALTILLSPGHTAVPTLLVTMPPSQCFQRGTVLLMSWEEQESPSATLAPFSSSYQAAQAWGIVAVRVPSFQLHSQAAWSLGLRQILVSVFS